VVAAQESSEFAIHVPAIGATQTGAGCLTFWGRRPRPGVRGYVESTRSLNVMRRSFCIDCRFLTMSEAIILVGLDQLLAPYFGIAPMECSGAVTSDASYY
jgi:hypothetical protein